MKYRTAITNRSHARQALKGYRRYCIRMPPEGVEAFERHRQPNETIGETLERIAKNHPVEKTPV